MRQLPCYVLSCLRARDGLLGVHVEVVVGEGALSLHVLKFVRVASTILVAGLIELDHLVKAIAGLRGVVIEGVGGLVRLLREQELALLLARDDLGQFCVSTFPGVGRHF